MKERVLITGASGFVGYHLIEAATKAGLEVHAGVRPGSKADHLKSFDLSYSTPDYSDPLSLKKELEENQYEYIIHAAGSTKATSEQEYEKVNAFYTKNLAMAADKASIPLKKFVFISSLAALGPAAYQEINPIRENRTAMPLTAYGRSKLLAEKYLAAMEGLPLVVLRPTAVYGPREKDIFLLFKAIHRGLDPYIGRKPQRLSFIYVKDLANVAIKALLLNKNQESYNLSDGNSYDRYALADISMRLLGKRAFRFHLPVAMVKGMAKMLEAAYATEGKVPALNKEKLAELTAGNWNCSIEKIKKELGFVPEYDLEKGLNLTLQWYKEYKWL